jgi:hypothetical protein
LDWEGSVGEGLDERRRKGARVRGLGQASSQKPPGVTRLVPSRLGTFEPQTVNRTEPNRNVDLFGFRVRVRVRFPVSYSNQTENRFIQPMYESAAETTIHSEPATQPDALISLAHHGPSAHARMAALHLPSPQPAVRSAQPHKPQSVSERP